MKIFLSFLFLLLTYSGFSQCSFPLQLNSTGICVGDTLKVFSTSSISRIIWFRDDKPFDTVYAINTGTGQIVAGGNGPGSAGNQLKSPWRIFVDKKGNLYVADADNFRVTKWAPGATSGVTVAGGNGPGTANNQVNPYGIYIDDNDNIFITDFANDRVMKWPAGASSGTVVAGGNGRGIAANQFNGPVSICLDKTGAMYITDFSNSRIQKWLQGAATGTTVAGGNGAGPAANQLNYPFDAVVDGNGYVYIADGGNYRIQRWAPGAVSGITIAGGNGIGAAPNQFNGTASLFVDAGGNVYIADNSNYRVQKWPPGATSGITVAGGNGAGTGANQFNSVQAVFVTDNGDIYVADIQNCRVQKWPFKPSIDTARKTSQPGIYKAVIAYANGCTDTTNTILIHPAGTTSVSIIASPNAICAGTAVTFTAMPVNGGIAPVYQWQVNGVNTGTNNPIFTSNLLKDKDVVSCTMTNNEVCITTPVVRSNSIVMAVDNYTAAPVNIIASANPICSGTDVEFSAATTGNATVPFYQWQVNGINAGSNSPHYAAKNLSNGDVITCTASSAAGCFPAHSNSITMMVNPSPKVSITSPIVINAGESIILHPVVTGPVTNYSWTPGKHLSDTAILNPVANPLRSTVYTLTVWTDKNCSAGTSVKVGVSMKLSIPNAFSPNGDNRNDVFYVLGGPDGSLVHDLAVFNRWGQRIFHVRDVQPGDPAGGWKGDYKGIPVATGTYVYVLVMRLAGGSEETIKGTLELIR